MTSKDQLDSNPDLFGIWRQYTDSICTYVEKTVPQYHQSISNLYQEYIEAWKNIACSAIDLQKGLANKAGMSTSIPDATLKIANDAENESKTAIDVQNKINIATIDAAKNSLSKLNATTNDMVSLNRNILQLWPSFQPKS